MHSTKTTPRWTFAVIVVALTGCTSQEPGAPPPEQAAEVAPVESHAVGAVEAERVKPIESPAAASPENAAGEEGPQLVAPANESTNEPQEEIARLDDAEPQARTAFYRGDSAPAEIPRVELSKGHDALCRVKVGDTMPPIELPRIGGRADRIELADLSGDKATVVVFWTADRRMARELLADLRYDVIEQFGGQGIAVVGIAVRESDQRGAAVLRQVGASFPNLLDRDGEAFAKVGSDRLPRTYLLDPNGKILWFDIEYSLSTRRELHRALRAVTGEPASAGGR